MQAGVVTPDHRGRAICRFAWAACGLRLPAPRDPRRACMGAGQAGPGGGRHRAQPDSNGKAAGEVGRHGSLSYDHWRPPACHANQLHPPMPT